MAIRRWPSVVTGPLGDRMAKFLEAYAKADEIYITSGKDGDHGRSSHHYGLSYNGSPTAALDIGAGGQGAGSTKMRDFAKWLYDNYAAFTVELIHSTPFPDDDGFYVKNQIKYPGGGPYGSPSAIGHFDHIHWATSQALLTRIEQRAGDSAPARVHADVVTADAPTGVANTAPVWGWDASEYDWNRGPMNLVAAERDGISFFIYKATEGNDWRAAHYQQALERARGAGIPVLGTYHFLWPNNIEAQVDFWMDTVDAKTPWWKDVPWIWQIDAEKSPNAPRTANPAEILQTVNLVKQRLADRGNTGYVIGYTPKWLYRDTLTGGYDIWASNYTGSGAARPFKDQYQGVTDFQAGWKPMSGRKPRILQFASDGQVGTQHTCCVDKFDGDLYDLIRLCGREPQPLSALDVDLQVAGPAHAGDVPAADALMGTNGFGGAREPARQQLGGYPAGELPMGLTGEEQRELLELARQHAGYRSDRPGPSRRLGEPDDDTAARLAWSGDGDLYFSLVERLAVTYGDRQAIALLKQVAAAAKYPERQEDARRAASILDMVSNKAKSLN
jgi:GH25 family lysozyme M1 (1,4-beta-N-acetylmuramidase)